MNLENELIKKPKSNEISFFAVGCWNVGVSKKQRLVFDEIIHNQDKMNKLLILGDNIYTNDDVNKEEYRKEANYPKNANLIENKKNHDLFFYNKGLHAILKSSRDVPLDKEVYFVLGNHDINVKQKDCEIYKKQIHINEYHTNLFTKFPYGSEIIESHDRSISVHLICIDTNFTEKGLDYSGISCINSNNREYLIGNKQLLWLENELKRSTSDFILIMGHHPIFFNKMKFDDDKKVFKEKQGSIPELIKLFGKYSHKNITYLCADNHMYQDWTITYPNGNKINEIICGTGGAPLDLGNNPKIHYVLDDVIFERDLEINNTNGFCQLLFQKKSKNSIMKSLFFAV